MSVAMIRSNSEEELIAGGVTASRLIRDVDAMQQQIF